MVKSTLINPILLVIVLSIVFESAFARRYNDEGERIAL